MAEKFNFSRLANLIRNDFDNKMEATSCNLKDGRGRFEFFVFFSADEDWRLDHKSIRLYIFLLRTHRLLGPFKLYGRHNDGVCTVFFDEDAQLKIKDELGLNNPESRTPFSFTALFEKLNTQIPLHSSRKETIERIKNNDELRNEMRKHNENASKTNLLGIKNLPPGKNPQAGTLRKLYSLDEPADKIANLIELLQKFRKTVAWTEKPVGSKAFDELVQKVKMQ